VCTKSAAAKNPDTHTHTHTSIQVISNVKTATHYSFSLHLRSRHTAWHTTLDCAILPIITGMTPVTKLDIISSKIQKVIKLADKQFNEAGGIHLLLGTDFFYEISRPGICTHPGNYPILQETVLG
jgi:hypothetical protein